MLRFYYYANTCSLASQIALEEAGVDYNAIAVNIALDDRGSYTQINPDGKVPSLVIDGRLLTENVGILTWLAECFPKAHLMPSDLMIRAQTISFIAWCSNTAHIARRQARRPNRFTPDAVAHAALQKSGREAFWKALQAIEQRLLGNVWMMGDQYTVADCYAMVFYNWAVLDDHDVTQLPEYTRFKDQMLTRSSTVRALQTHKSPLIL
jgi:glutathione S-transferase